MTPVQPHLERETRLGYTYGVRMPKAQYAQLDFKKVVKSKLVQSCLIDFI